MKEAVGILILFVPLIVELIGDRNGDFNKRQDTIYRGLMIIGSGILVWIITDRNLFASINLSFAIHWILFDYLIHIILYRNGVIVSPEWFNYLGKSSKVDKIQIWKSIGPYGRLFVKLFYFLVSLYLYLTI